ncbi:bifunctional allantoicase/(S)-ureidoglycine aminohydrolase [Methylobacterium aerolatum]|uniref:(S)-ureidoglycine aminohydrolase n=1 Tax=Methylobacterium aerolatum TaxID=418708 RepID=A0ABU0I0G8_9HYPH|nr:bifunctional allantoicase/(S)-ureidoglycine aminohydrolase [Methylobacterium aerolatum]MDQ0448103.1 (S)-ureidoglycine aminohydrolase [Methylobacterium aerolatum]GJD35773.1 (S)-ureidoglycine aminohydrolase [Methylobacterium aerolatum]
MTHSPYNPPSGGLPGQTSLMTGRAVFTEAYAVIPHGVMSDIVTSALPFWTGTKAWILARPLSGFAETFAQYLMEVAPGGGSAQPEPDPTAQGVLFVVDGQGSLEAEGGTHPLRPGSYAYLAPGTAWSLRNDGATPLRFHWVRKVFEPVPGLEAPTTFVTHESAVEPVGMVGTEGAWATTRFVSPEDLRHDMHVNIVTLRPGASIPFEETHIMEHGLFILEGKAVYRLNRDWVEVEAGDFLWLRAYCPQACYAGGPGPFRYLLYKDVNRHPALRLQGGAR